MIRDRRKGYADKAKFHKAALGIIFEGVAGYRYILIPAISPGFAACRLHSYLPY
jgi:hypothetical protein